MLCCNVEFIFLQKLLIRSKFCSDVLKENYILPHQNDGFNMFGEMVQNSQSLYSLTVNAFIVIHKYIYSHSSILH